MSDEPKRDDIAKALEILAPPVFKGLPHLEFPSRLDRLFHDEQRTKVDERPGWERTDEVAGPLWNDLAARLSNGGSLEQERRLVRLNRRKKRAAAQWRLLKGIRALQAAFVEECIWAAARCGAQTSLKDSLPLHRTKLENRGWAINKIESRLGDMDPETLRRLEAIKKKKKKTPEEEEAPEEEAPVETVFFCFPPERLPGTLRGWLGIPDETVDKAFLDRKYGYASEGETWEDVFHRAVKARSALDEEKKEVKDRYELFAFHSSLIGRALAYYDLLGYVPPWEVAKPEAGRREEAERWARIGLDLFDEDPDRYQNRSQLTLEIAKKVGASEAKYVQDKLAEAGLYDKRGPGRPKSEDEKPLLEELIQLWRKQLGNGEREINGDQRK